MQLKVWHAKVMLGANFIVTLDRLGSSYLQLQQFTQSESAYENALVLLDNLEGLSLEWIGKERAVIYHQLGRVAEEQRQWETAVSHYHNALQIYIDFNDRYEQAGVYHQLGRVAQEQRQWETAVSHYHNALQIKIEFNDRYSQGSTLNQLGSVAEEQELWAESIESNLQAIEIAAAFQDEYRVKTRTGNLAGVWQAAAAQDAAFAAQSPAPARLAGILGVSVAEAREILKDEG